MMQAHIDQYLHELRATLPEDIILEQTAGSLLTACPTGQDLVAAPASQAYVVRGSAYVDGLQLAAETLSKNLEMRVFLKLNRLGVTV